MTNERFSEVVQLHHPAGGGARVARMQRAVARLEEAAAVMRFAEEKGVKCSLADALAALRDTN